MNMFLTIPFATIASTWSLWQIANRRYNNKNSNGANGSSHCEFANIGEGTRESGHLSLLGDTGTPPQTTSRFLLVKFSTDGDHFTTCGAGDVPLGINQDVYDPNNTDVPNNIALLGAAHGTQRVVTDGTIANGNYVKTGANGQATVATTGVAGIFGMAVFGTDTTAAAGDTITVVTSFPSKYAF
jgi:hypothetical protein